MRRTVEKAITQSDMGIVKKKGLNVREDARVTLKITTSVEDDATKIISDPVKISSRLQR